MRIACIHVPQFALQCATRLDPSLRGAAVVVVGGSDPGRERSGPLHAPLVLACSRAAWALGVRLGMTATAARQLSPDVKVVSAELQVERETVRAVADALLGLAPIVDVGARVGAGGAHLAMYAEVPAKTRGQTFGERVIETLDELGIAARIGIADDRFTAWVAAAHGGAEDRGIVSVPRGGSAAYLSPRPLSLLAITPEVQHMLEALGVRTLGEFAALPAPSVARPLEADYQALARGESGASLRPYAPEAPIREEIIVSAGNVLEAPGSLSGPAAVALVARRTALRLAGRDRGAARLEVTAGDREMPVSLSNPLTDAADLARVLAPSVEVARQGAWRLRVVVAGEAVAGGEAVEVAAEQSAQLQMVQSQLVDPLEVVLATSGSLFTLSSPRAERRDAHRRTRRGKQRRSRPVPLAQSKLFDRRS
jgi:protein ImuB